MKTSRYAKALIAAVTATIAVKISTYLQTHSLLTHEAILLAACFAAFISISLDKIIENIQKRYRFLRKIVDKRARFEGDWFVETDPGSRMPYGAISIDYNYEQDTYGYSGTAYNQEGLEASEWSCDSLQFDIPHNMVRFLCRTSIKGDGGKTHEAYGWIKFKKVHLRRTLRFVRGNGFFSVIDIPDLKGEFSVERFDPKFVKKILGQPSIATKSDIAKVVSAFHSMRDSISIDKNKMESSNKSVELTSEAPPHP